LSFLGNDDIRLLADAVVGNTTMEKLNISDNNLASKVLENIARLIESMPLLHTIILSNDYTFGLFRDWRDDNVKRFVATLQHKNTTLQALVGGISEDRFPGGEALYTNIDNSLTRNSELNNVGLLITPPHSHSLLLLHYDLEARCFCLKSITRPSPSLSRLSPTMLVLVPFSGYSELVHSFWKSV
jgi:hypothetical protein